MVRKSSFHGELFETLYEQNAFVYLLVRSNPQVFLTVWDGPVPPLRFGEQGELDAAVSCLHERLCRGQRWRQLLSSQKALRSLASIRLERPLHKLKAIAAR